MQRSLQITAKIYGNVTGDDFQTDLVALIHPSISVLSVFPRGARCVCTQYARAPANAGQIMRSYERMLARAARIKCSDSSRMLTSSSACSRGNQPARDAKTCCGSSERRCKCLTVPSRGYQRCPRVVEYYAGNSWRGEEEPRGAIARDDRARAGKSWQEL